MRNGVPRRRRRGRRLPVSIAEPDASARRWIGDLSGAELLALGSPCARSRPRRRRSRVPHAPRSYGNVLVRLDGIETTLADSGSISQNPRSCPSSARAGSPAPAFSARSLAGEEMTLGIADVSRRCRRSSSSRALAAGQSSRLLPTASAWQTRVRRRSRGPCSSPMGRRRGREEAEGFELATSCSTRIMRLYGASRRAARRARCSSPPTGRSAAGSPRAASGSTARRRRDGRSAPEAGGRCPPSDRRRPHSSCPRSGGRAGVTRGLSAAVTRCSLLEPRLRLLPLDARGPAPVGGLDERRLAAARRRFPPATRRAAARRGSLARLMDASSARPRPFRRRRDTDGRS